MLVPLGAPDNKIMISYEGCPRKRRYYNVLQKVPKRYAWKRIRRYEQVEIINQRQDLPFLQQWKIVEMAAKIIFFVCSTPTVE
jgi:hypothetical protein